AAGTAARDVRLRGRTQRTRRARGLGRGGGARAARPHDPRGRARLRQRGGSRAPGGTLRGGRVERRRDGARHQGSRADRGVRERGARRRGGGETGMSTSIENAAGLLAACIEGRLPDERGRFGPYGGRYVPETLVSAFERLEACLREHLHSEAFQAEYARELETWVGRPTALTFAPSLSRLWGAEVWLKREDLAHTGAHKINNAIGQALLARRHGVRRVIAETGAGQHGVASAAACARVGLPCRVYMGAVDMERQAPNVDRMRRLGAEVVPVESGDRTLRAAIDEALRDWVKDPDGTWYLLGSAVGAHPYPYLVRELQSVIGREARAQMLAAAGALPDAAFACVGGGSNAIGLFHPLLADEGT